MRHVVKKLASLSAVVLLVLGVLSIASLGRLDQNVELVASSSSCARPGALGRPTALRARCAPASAGALRSATVGAGTRLVAVLEGGAVGARVIVVSMSALKAA